MYACSEGVSRNDHKSGSECMGSPCKVYGGVSDKEEGNSDIHPGIALRIDQLWSQASEQSPSGT